MNNEQNQKKDAKKLPGFYIALCSCVLVIGLAGYFTERNQKSRLDTAVEDSADKSVFSGNIDEYADDAVNRGSVPASETITQEEYAAETEEIQAASGNAAATDAEPEAAEVYNADYTEPQLYEDVDYTVEDYAVDNPDTAAAVIVSAKSSAFEMPVSGDILEGFSDKLVYNSAMSDWRTHDGIDLAADTGCSVHAAANGTVSRIISSALGEGVEITHADGYVTRYMGLGSIESLSEGDSVAAGDVIGLVGESKGESVTEPHLHFEVIKDGTAVDPKEFM